MRPDSPSDRLPGRPDRAVALWLWVLVGLVVAMVAVGGATRLTGSGLSITEWRPVTGALPPLSAENWAGEFAKYRGSSQFSNLNSDITLDEFRSLYWWEWSHRQLGRAIGLAFFVPLLFFWGSGRLGGRRALLLLGIGALGGLQATVGWIMVASGLEPGMVAVAPVKLTLHLLIATLILVCLTWQAAGAGGSAAGAGGPGAREAGILLGLTVLQVALGGLVAGSKAGLTYNTWPLMDGRLTPPPADLFARTPWVENFVDNPALVQLDHRVGAYAVLAWAVWCAVAAARRPSVPASRRATGLAILVLAQAALGVTTLLLAVPLPAALAHQVLAMVIVCAATRHLRLSVRPRSARPAGSPEEAARPAGTPLSRRPPELAPAGARPR